MVTSQRACKFRLNPRVGLKPVPISAPKWCTKPPKSSQHNSRPRPNLERKRQPDPAPRRTRIIFSGNDHQRPHNDRPLATDSGYRIPRHNLHKRLRRQPVKRPDYLSFLMTSSEYLQRRRNHAGPKQRRQPAELYPLLQGHQRFRAHKARDM